MRPANRNETISASITLKQLQDAQDAKNRSQETNSQEVKQGFKKG